MRIIQPAPDIYGATLPYCSRDAKQSTLGVSLQTSFPSPSFMAIHTSQNQLPLPCVICKPIWSCLLCPPAAELEVVCKEIITIKYCKDNHLRYIKIIQAHHGTITESNGHIALGVVQKNHGYGQNQGHQLLHSDMTAWLHCGYVLGFHDDATRSKYNIK